MRTILVILMLLLYGCGKEEPRTFTDKGIIANTLYLNSSTLEFTPSNSYLYGLVEDEINQISREEILNRAEGRAVKIKFGDLSESLLGLTECYFYYDAKKTNCVITLSQKINPDLSISAIDEQRKIKLFNGVLRHEIGHAFGMGHNLTDPNDLMYPTFSFTHVENLTFFIKFVQDLLNFRYNGPSSGIRTLFDDK